MPDPTPPPGFKVGTQTIPGDGYRQAPRTVPVWFNEETGVIVPVGTPPGHIPSGGSPGDAPGEWIIPQTRSVLTRTGTNEVPITPLGPFPTPGFTPGMGVPPPGSIPGEEEGTFIIPGSPGTSGDYRGVGAAPPTPDQGPFPFPTDPNFTPTVGPELPGQTFLNMIPPFPSPPTPASVKGYISQQAQHPQQFISPEQMFGFQTPPWGFGTELGFFPSAEQIKSAKAGVTQQIGQSWGENQLAPWITQAIMGGMGGLTQGLQPSVQPLTLTQPPGYGMPPLLDPSNWPAGTGGGLNIPSSSEILGGVGNMLFPEFFPAPQQPAPQPSQMQPSPMPSSLPFPGGY